MYIRQGSLREVCEYIATVEGFVYIDGPEGFLRIPDPNDPDKCEITEKLIDPAASHTMQDGSMSILAQMAAIYDMACIPADNSLDVGIEAVRQVLTCNTMTGRPGIYFFSNLHNTFSEIRKYKLRQDKSSKDSHATKDEPLRKHNHLMDTLRYGVVYIRMGNTEDPIYRLIAGRPRNRYRQAADRLETHIDHLRELENRRNAHPWLGDQF
jgi:hypothetical protein